MNIFLLGLNHNTAPVSLRERFSLSGCGLELALQEFVTTYLATRTEAMDSAKQETIQFQELAILSTCNRLELYAVVGSEQSPQHTEDGLQNMAAPCVALPEENGTQPHAIQNSDGLSSEQIKETFDRLCDFLTGLQNISKAEITPHLYSKHSEESIAHLLRVACGLESMILGEPQILGQVSRMQKEAQNAETIGPVLSHLCSQAIRTGRRAHTETSISRHSISVSHAAVRLAAQKCGGMLPQRALVVGAGEMAELAAKALQLNGVPSIAIINRTYSAAERIAQDVNTHTTSATALEWEQLDLALLDADVVFCATGAPHTVIHVEEVEPVLPRRSGRPLLLMDLAVPLDVDKAVDGLPGVSCCDVDDLKDAIDENMAQRRTAIPHVEEIIAQEQDHVIDWLSGRQMVPVITEMRRRAAVIAAAEVAETKLRLRNLEQHFAQSEGRLTAEIAGDLAERLAHRIVRKLMHEPTIRLKEQAVAGHSQEAASLIADIFDLSIVSPLTPTQIATVELSPQTELLPHEQVFETIIGTD